jgi:uncharacterized protein (UPF0548 family)
VRPSPSLLRRLHALERAPVNYDPAALDLAHPPPGWLVDRRLTPLTGEAPGEPEDGGSFQVASRLIRGYEFADPSLVRAFYDRDAPLQHRTMLLELRALGVVSIHVGVRVVDVFDDTLVVQGRRVRRFGWAYRTLQGHVERGQMDWQVWKWLDSGEVEFRVRAVSQIASIPNPIVWIGFRALRGYERRLFLDSTGRRMQRLTESALHEGSSQEAVRASSAEFTARANSSDDPAHAQLADELREDGGRPGQ